MIIIIMISGFDESWDLKVLILVQYMTLYCCLSKNLPGFTDVNSNARVVLFLSFVYFRVSFSLHRKVNLNLDTFVLCKYV